jgi:DNA-binding NarL/FixJ family response regulator
LCQGLDNRAIADQLVLGYATVRGHVQNILDKLEAHSKLEAVARARHLGLIS